MAHKVLIVDDEPSIRLTLAEFLRREGFEPLTASDAAQGSALFESDGGVEVAVVDINLPGRSGIELLREFRERDPRVPVIVITGEPNVAQLPEIVRGGAYDFLPKPVLKDSITRAVARAAEKKRLDDEKRRLEEEVRRHTEELELRVTERTADLAAAHSFLNLVLDSSTEYAIVVIDPGFNVTLFNRGAELLFGYTAAEAIGQSLDLIIPERLRRAHWDAYDRALRTGATKYTDRVLTTRSMHKDGRKLYVDLGFGLVKDATGAVTGAFATGRDCTERYLADGALKARVRELEATR